jgi:hypothetical protein
MIAEGQNNTDYANLEAVREEVAFARKLCRQNEWPIIDVTRRSIEETAATVMTLYARHRGEDTP